MLLLFKPGYTIRLNKDEQFNRVESMNLSGIDDRLIWCYGIGTIGEISNKVLDVTFFKNRYFLLKLLIVSVSNSLYLS